LDQTTKATVFLDDSFRFWGGGLVMTSDPKIKKLSYKALTNNNLYHL